MSKLIEWIKRADNNIAITYRNDNSNHYESISYKTLYNNMLAVANYLSNYKGKTIAIIGINKLEYVVTLLSVLSFVGNVFLVDKELDEDMINHLFDKVKPDLIVLDNTLKFSFEIPSIVFADINKIMMKSNFTELDNVFSGKCILHTSGTTGEPKLIELTEEQYTYIIPYLNKAWKVTSKHACLFIIPIYHVYALISLFHGIYAGLPNILEYDFNKLESVLKETHPSIFLGVPLIYNKIKDATYEKIGKRKLNFALFLSNCLLGLGIDIRKKLFKELHDYFGGNYYFGVTGGSIANPETNKFFDAVGLPVYSGYGMTETSGPISICYAENNRYDSVGYILANTINVKNKNEQGIGEIWVSGTNIISNYLYDQDKHNFDNTYFNTGDLGYIKENFLYITGRNKDILIGDNGKNIAVKELVTKIMTNKEIKDCTIVMENNYLVAILDTDLTNEQVELCINAVNKTLPKYKQISTFRIVDKGFK